MAQRQVANDEYRRRARRLRHEHRLEPARLMRSLTALAAKAEKSPEPTPSSEATLAKRFAAEVAGRMDGGVLRYSARAALLKRAEKLGIGRFEANLLIAMVIHAAQRIEAADPKPRPRWLRTLALVLLIEGLIGTGVWWILRGL